MFIYKIRSVLNVATGDMVKLAAYVALTFLVSSHYPNIWTVLYVVTLSAAFGAILERGVVDTPVVSIGLVREAETTH